MRVAAILASVGLAGALRISLPPSRASAGVLESGRPSGCKGAAWSPSAGAPPIWPCRELKAQLNESKLRDLLDTYKSPRTPAIAFPKVQGSPSPAGLGTLSGAQPFVFGHLVASSARVVREVERPVDNQVVYQHTKFDGKYFGVPESVFFDDGRFLMYYHSTQQEVGGLARVESHDGIHWENFTRLNITMHWSVESCVLLDEYERDPRFKWKMIARCQGPGALVCLFSSANGLDWAQHGNGPLYGERVLYGERGDTLPCLYHDGRNQDYQMIIRREVRNPAVPGRGIRGGVVVGGPLGDLLRSSNHRHVSWQASVLSNFTFDREGGLLEMFRRQLYSLSRTLLPGAGFVGVAQVYEFVQRNKSREAWRLLNQTAHELGLAEKYDSVGLYLMPSQDGLSFDPSFVYAGVQLLPPDMTRGYHFFNQAGQVLTRGGYHWFYYDRNSKYHISRWTRVPEFALARFEENRIVRIRAVDGHGGVVVTQNFTFDAQARLALDVLALSPYSELTAELLPAGAAPLELLELPAALEAEDLRGANGTVPIRWREDASALHGSPVHLRIRLAHVYLYGFSVWPKA